MKILAISLVLAVLPLAAQTPAPQPAAHDVLTEHLGTVNFPTSCSPDAQPYLNRGVALLHDFWYDEASRQFKLIAEHNPTCAIAHWGIAISSFHQIWDRPSPDTMKAGWAEMQTAQKLAADTPATTPLEHAYIDALADFYKPGPAEFPARVNAYSAALGTLYANHPDDVDAGAFYALTLLSAKPPTDDSLAPEEHAMQVLKPLAVRFPDNPGVVHYIIHAGDNPTLAPQALAAADHYGEIAPDGGHAFHMPGHIYSRLGLWQKDVDSQVGSIEAAERAEAHGEPGVMDELHSYDFLLYAYLQSGQDTRAKAALAQSSTAVDRIAAMPGMTSHRVGMIPYYRFKLPAFYALEMHDWKTAAAMQPTPDSPPEVSTMVYWVRAIGAAHLGQAQQARADLAKYDELIDQIKHGKYAYMAEGSGNLLTRDEIVAWVAFAEHKELEALNSMRHAADLQDKAGQGEVDIPAREMLADILLAYGKPQQALAEYETSLRLSPNRLNGLFNAGRAAEAAGDKPKAQAFYASLLKNTDNGKASTRPEFAHATTYLGAPQVAKN